MPESREKDAATLAVAYEAARKEPVAALELARSLPPNPDRDALLEHAINQWSAIAPAAAQAWVAQIADLSLKEHLLANVAIASAEQDPVKAANLAANSLEPGEAQDRAAVAIVQRWVQQSPNAAASWVIQFPDSNVRDAALENLVLLWTANSPLKNGYFSSSRG